MLHLHTPPDTQPDQRRLTRHHRGSEVCGVRLLIAGKGEQRMLVVVVLGGGLGDKGRRRWTECQEMTGRSVDGVHSGEDL